MKKRIHRKLEDIRQQPPHVRFQKAGTYTILAGAGIFVLWLFLLLPIQLHVRTKADSVSTPDLVARLLGAATPEDPSQTQPPREPQVGGAQDDTYRRPLPSGPFFKTATPSNTAQDFLDATASPQTSTTPTPTVTPGINQ